MLRVLVVILVVMTSVAFAQKQGKPESDETPRFLEEKVEFGKVPNGQIRTLLDHFLIELQNSPNAQGYIFNYGTKKEIANREKLLCKHITYRRFDASRLTFIRAEVEKEIKTQFRIVPEGMKPPTS